MKLARIALPMLLCLLAQPVLAEQEASPSAQSTSSQAVERSADLRLFRCYVHTNIFNPSVLSYDINVTVKNTGSTAITNPKLLFTTYKKDGSPLATFTENVYSENMSMAPGALAVTEPRMPEDSYPQGVTHVGVQLLDGDGLEIPLSSKPARLKVALPPMKPKR